MVYKKEGFGPRKTFIRRAYFCTDFKNHPHKIKLEKYASKTRKKIQRTLYICPECKDLYFKSSTHVVPMFLGNESILISNIDSPENNSIVCPVCGSIAAKANNDDAVNNYFCNDCYTMITEKKDATTAKKLFTWFPDKEEN